MRKTLVCTSLAIICAWSAALLAGARSERSPDATVLAPGGVIERRVARGDQHRYLLSLTHGELARVIVEQQGIDVLVDVHDADDRPIDEFQDEIRPFGAETVDLVAAKEGTYSLTVKAADGAVAPGGYTIRLQSLRPATGDDRVMQESRSLRTAAGRLQRLGRFAEARPMFERALSLSEGLRGPGDAYVAMVIADLAGNALEQHDDARAWTLYERAIAAFDAVWGAEHPFTAMARSRLALVHQRAGQRRQAEDLARAALAVIERSLGPDHPWFVRCLVILANLRDDAGDMQEAEAINRRALAILEKTQLTGTMLEATLLNNLGDLYRQKNENATADALFRRSLEIAESLQGPDSYFVSTAVQNLGIVARERKDYAAALNHYARALAIRERLVGANHPDLAGLLNNLANVYRATGENTMALATHFRALQLWERAAGPYARETLVSVGNIARTYASMGDIADALAFQRRADAILEVQLSLDLATGSERQKLAFARSVSERTDRTLSLHLEQASGDADAASLASLVLLQRKGRVQDAMTNVFAAVRQRVADPADRALMDRLNETTAQLARLVLHDPEAARPPSGEQSVARLEQRKEELEATLSEHSAEFRAQLRPVTLEAVQAVMPDDAALLEFAVFRPFDPTAERNAEAYAPAHYAAYVVRKRGIPVGVDLGAVADIDRLIGRFRDTLRDPAIDVRASARALDERVMQPLRRSIDGATHLLISPDGELNLVPFESLIDAQGRYLIDRYATSYLTSGRDLLRMQIPRANPGTPVIVADPLFGEPTAAQERARRTQASALARRSITSGTALSRLYFAPLSGSAAEARTIKSLFPESTLLMGSQATKATLAQVKAPRILHIASHGFFLNDDHDQSGAAKNPLLRSGLALAGGNLAQGDGILTALEASGLDLWGTKLVTLSACDTGVGEIRNHEGVYGLRRAFVLAGAETLVMSLWPVSDYIARDAMVGYYTRLRAGLGRGEALRQAKLAILKQPNRQHPYYWAGFIQSGEWADLDGRR
jgi:CHAT domain-containing protein/Tfp pilus assembly protein PilF